MNSCCCMRLNTAGIFIGWIGAVLSFIYIILCAVALGNLDEIAHYIVEQLNNTKIADEAAIRTTILVGASVYLPINAINLISSALLIIGTVNERHLLLVPWLINYGILMILSATVNIRMLVEISENMNSGNFIFPIIVFALSFLFQFYIWYAIYSLFKKLQASRELRPLLLPTTGASYPSYTKI